MVSVVFRRSTDDGLDADADADDERRRHVTHIPRTHASNHDDGDDNVCVRDGDESDDATDGFDEPTNEEDGGTDPSLF